MEMKSLKIVLALALSIIVSHVRAQVYINSTKMLENLEEKVNTGLVKMEDINKLYTTFHEDKNNRKITFKTREAEKKELSPEDLFANRMPMVYMFLQVYESARAGKMKINGSGTAFPISEDGYFLINSHMIDELGLGSGDPSKVDTSIHLILSDYEGNILTIDSVVSYSKEADIAIIKANTKGKKIQAIPLGQDLKAGASVFAITHPRGYYYYYSTGRVARMTENDFGIMGRKMEITADYAAGSSGGPIFDSKGNIAGIVSLTKSFYYNQQEQKNLQMVIKEAIPVSSIRNLINN